MQGSEGNTHCAIRDGHDKATGDHLLGGRTQGRHKGQRSTDPDHDGRSGGATAAVGVDTVSWPGSCLPGRPRAGIKEGRTSWERDDGCWAWRVFIPRGIGAGERSHTRPIWRAFAMSPSFAFPLGDPSKHTASQSDPAIAGPGLQGCRARPGPGAGWQYTRGFRVA
jgi:hypothetical protein